MSDMKAPRRPGTSCLTAAHHGSLHLAVGAGLTASAPSRTVVGLVLPFNRPGRTSAGVVTVAGPGHVRLPADLSRIKLVDEHQTPPRPIGYATAAEETPDGLRMTFRIGATPAGDAALLDASEGLRDAFSVELIDVDIAADGGLTDSLLTAVALVTVPAYADARVESVAASLTPTEGHNPMTPEQRARLAELIAAQNLTDEERAELNELTTLAVTEMAQAADAPPADAPQVPAGAVASAAASFLASLSLPGLTASVPSGLSLTGATPGGRPIGELYASLAAIHSGRSRPELEAALADITSTANVWTSQDEYGGQLWQGAQYKRRWVDLLAPKPLTSYKGTGWRWVVKPQVADYAGDKTAVPSNSPTTEAVAWTAARLAGAHDIDRKFVDFGDTEFIQAYYEALTEDYAKKSDAKARAAVLAGIGVTVAGGAIKLFEAVALGAATISSDDDTVGVGQDPDYIIVSQADFLDLVGVTNNNVPAYLEMLGVDPAKFKRTTELPAGTVVVGVKAAVTWRELGGSPIRVEAVNIVNGGVDGGVFGYYATHENHDLGRVKVTFTGGVV